MLAIVYHFTDKASSLANVVEEWLFLSVGIEVNQRYFIALQDVPPYPTKSDRFLAGVFVDIEKCLTGAVVLKCSILQLHAVIL
jgi:hypothetical protein